MLYNRLFYYSVWDENEQPILIENQTFKYLIINGVNKKLSFKRHCMFDMHFLNKFSKKSNYGLYLRLPIYVNRNSANVNQPQNECEECEERGKTTFVSSDKNNQNIFFRDIIQHFYMAQIVKDTKKMLCSDLFSAIEQTLSKQQLGFMKAQWHQQSLSSFLSTGVVEIPTGNYCVLSGQCNSTTHDSAKMSMEISMDGALYLKCSVCLKENRMQQILWEKKTVGSPVHNSLGGTNEGDANVDPRNLRWNLFQDDFELPEALPTLEPDIAKEVKKFLHEHCQNKTECLEFIEEELDKQDRGMARILSHILKGRVKIMDKGNKIYLWNGCMWDEDVSRTFHVMISTYSHYIVDLVMEEVAKKISDLNSVEITDKNQENAIKATKKRLESKNKQFRSFRDKYDKGITR